MSLTFLFAVKLITEVFFKDQKANVNEIALEIETEMENLCTLFATNSIMLTICTNLQCVYYLPYAVLHTQLVASSLSKCSREIGHIGALN